MTWEWVVAGLVLVLIIAWIRRITTSTSRYLSEAHILEVMQALPALKAAALRGGPDIADPETDQRILRTSGGLRFYYTIDAEDDGTYVHHMSLAMIGKRTVGAVAQCFLFLTERQLGLPHDQAEFGVAPSTIHHLEWRLTPEQQAAFVSRTPPVVTAESLRELFKTLNS